MFRGRRSPGTVLHLVYKFRVKWQCSEFEDLHLHSICRYWDASLRPSVFNSFVLSGSVKVTLLGPDARNQESTTLYRVSRSIVMVIDGVGWMAWFIH